MHTAYKYMKMDKGLLLVFETRLSFGSGLSLNVVKIENDLYLKIGQDHYVHLDGDTIDCLKDWNRLHVAVSGSFESRITLQGTIEIDDISIGKLLAYVEMEKSS